MANKTSELIKQRLIELASQDALPMDLTQIDAAIFDPYTTNRLYVINNDSDNISNAMGIDINRTEKLCEHLSKCMTHAYFGNDEHLTRAELMSNISSVCENTQELGYIMFKFGLEDDRFRQKVNEFHSILKK